MDYCPERSSGRARDGEMTTEPQGLAAGDPASRCFPRLRSLADGLSTTLRGERRDAAENRQRVLATARALFSERGVDAVSMHDIAVAAGIGQGTLYRRYPHKGALCHALVEDNLRQFHDAMVARLEAEAAGGRALQQLRAFIDALLAFTEQNGPLVSAMGDSACGVTPAERYQNPWVVWQCETLALLLERAVAQRELRPIDVEATAEVIQAACEPPLYLYQRHQRGYSRERIVANLVRLLTGPDRGSAAIVRPQAAATTLEVER
jgi:AcrR family transcriptional regulator